MKTDEIVICFISTTEAFFRCAAQGSREGFSSDFMVLVQTDATQAYILGGKLQHFLKVSYNKDFNILYMRCRKPTFTAKHKDSHRFNWRNVLLSSNLAFVFLRNKFFPFFFREIFSSLHLDVLTEAVITAPNNASIPIGEHNERLWEVLSDLFHLQVSYNGQDTMGLLIYWLNSIIHICSFFQQFLPLNEAVNDRHRHVGLSNKSLFQNCSAHPRLFQDS